MKTICIAGKNDIAVDVLLHCIKNYSDHRIICICNRNEAGKNTWQKSLKWFAKRNHMEMVSLSDVYDIDDLLFLSLEFDRIIRPYKFRSDNLYNLHFSMLPKYKGMFTSVMPILNCESYTGVTLHRIREGIDTGEIIEQEKVMIGENDSSLDLYKKLIKQGTALMIKNLDSLLTGNVRYYAQDSKGSTYYSGDAIDYSTLQLDINRTAYQIKNQVRAFCFRPYQLISWNGTRYIDSTITREMSTEKPGKIMEDNEVMTRIATIDYDIVLYKDVFEKVLELIKVGENTKANSLLVSKKIIESQDCHGWTALTVAVYNNNIEMVETLISMGADIKVLNNNGTNLLMYAKDCYVNTKDPSIFEWLLSQGLSPDEEDYSHKSLIAYCQEEGITKIGSWVVG